MWATSCVRRLYAILIALYSLESFFSVVLHFSSAVATVFFPLLLHLYSFAIPYIVRTIDFHGWKASLSWVISRRGSGTETIAEQPSSKFGETSFSKLYSLSISSIYPYLRLWINALSLFRIDNTAFFVSENKSTVYADWTIATWQTWSDAIKMLASTQPKSLREKHKTQICEMKDNFL